MRNVADFLIYGATGYTGSLIAHEAVRRSARPILAGRNAEALVALDKKLKLEQRVFSLDDSAAVNAGLRGVSAVLHCAGPFAHTSKPMADGCLRASVHYLDITGEVEVFEALAARDIEAKKAGIMLLPGVGFDVVPSDCLAAHLKRRLPSASRLALGFLSLSRPSRGTATTIVENLHRGGLVRRDGVLTNVPAAWKTRKIDFGTGPVKAMTIPWGDLSTAYHSTGIPKIEVYMAAPMGTRLAARASRYLGRVLGSSFIQGGLKHRIQAASQRQTRCFSETDTEILWAGRILDVSPGRGLQQRGKFDPEALTVTILPSAPIPPGTAEEQVRARAAAVAKEAKVSYKRISIHVSGGE